MSDKQTPAIWDRMRELALSHPEYASELREKATAAEAAAAGYYGEPQTRTPQQFLGAMARARILFCKVSGEPLV